MIYFLMKHPSSSSLPEWHHSAVWPVHLLSARAELWRARWQKAVIFPPVWTGDGACQKYLRKKNLSAARLEWVSDDGTFQWMSANGKIHAKSERGIGGGCSSENVPSRRSFWTSPLSMRCYRRGSRSVGFYWLLPRPHKRPVVPAAEQNG